jgi:hypothetical protein
VITCIVAVLDVCNVDVISVVCREKTCTTNLLCSLLVLMLWPVSSSPLLFEYEYFATSCVHTPLSDVRVCLERVINKVKEEKRQRCAGLGIA